MNQHQQPAERVVTLLLVDDHAIVRSGLRAVLESMGRYAVVGEAATADEAVAAVGALRPTVVLLDVRLPGRSGIEACREIVARYPSARVLMLTSYADEETIIGSIGAGATGFLLKETDPPALAAAIDAVATGSALLDPAVVPDVFAWIRRAGARTGADPLASLTERQRDVLVRIADGKSNREIGAALDLSEATVKSYVSDLLRKLRFTRRTELAAFATRYRPRARDAESSRHPPG